MAQARSELGQALADAGGAGAPRDASARPRRLLDAELGRGARELGERRTGYQAPIAVAVASRDSQVVAALPVSPDLRADPGAVAERAGALAAASVEQLVVGASPGPPEGSRDLRLT